MFSNLRKQNFVENKTKNFAANLAVKKRSLVNTKWKATESEGKRKRKSKFDDYFDSSKKMVKSTH